MPIACKLYARLSSESNKLLLKSVGKQTSLKGKRIKRPAVNVSGG